MSEATPIQAQEVKFPETPQELDMYIANVFKNIMNIPSNGNAFATIVAQANLRALNNDTQRLSREMNKLVLVRAEYAGCVKATVLPPVEGEEILGVDLKVRNDVNEWIDPEALTEEQQIGLAKLVLSQTAMPGDVWFITTSGAVDAAQQEVTEMMEKNASKTLQ